MEMSCVYIFDGPRKHVELLEQLLDLTTTQQYKRSQTPEERQAEMEI